MKTLLVYYSITGAVIEELRDPRIKKGLPGYLRLARDAIGKVEATLAPVAQNPSSYDMVVLAGPVWSSKMCSPTMVYAREHKHDIKRAAFLCTSRSSEPGYAEQCMTTLTKVSGITPIAMLGLGHKELQEDHSIAVAEFVAALKATA
jgi:hypothetical protein